MTDRAGAASFDSLRSLRAASFDSLRSLRDLTGMPSEAI
jgi:hypothetical protein